jgi:hypothetical protein
MLKNFMGQGDIYVLGTLSRLTCVWLQRLLSFFCRVGHSYPWLFVEYLLAISNGLTNMVQHFSSNVMHVFSV